MGESTMINHNYSTTLLLTKPHDDSLQYGNDGKVTSNTKFAINNAIFNIKNSKIIGKQQDAFETMLFLPEGEGRQGEGGLRTRGYFKHSYKMVNGEWWIVDSDNNPVIPAPEDIQNPINHYLQQKNTQNQSPKTYSPEPKTHDPEPDSLPLISIITVVYNGAKYLEETIQSVINQSYPNVEYIIIDGGSIDGTLDIIKKYEDTIDYWVSEKDNGIYDAMNKGWILVNKNSRILFIGAGDTVLSLPSQKTIIENNDSIIYGKVYLKSSIFNSVHGWKLNIGNTLHHQALLVPKILHVGPPFNIEYPTYADYDFNLRLYRTGAKFIGDDKFISYAMPDGVSAQLKILEMAKISRRNSGLFWGALSFLYCCYQHIKSKNNNFIKR